MKRINKIFASKYWWLLLLLVLFGINFLASSFHARFDLTKEKRYTLSKATKDLLKNLDDEVQVDVFLKGNFPSKFRKLTNSVGEFLELLKEGNSAKLRYSFISPLEEIPGSKGIKYADTLFAMGAYPINLKAQVKTGESSSMAYPFALIKYNGIQKLVTLFSVPAISGSTNETPEKVINSAEALLEYQFVKALDDLIHPDRPLIGYSIGNGEPSLKSDARTADLQESLFQNYQLYTLNLKQQPIIPDTFKVLLIVKPSLQFSEDEKLKIDQYIMRGGKLLCFIDNLFAEQDSLRYKPEIIAYDRNLNLSDQFFKYGFRINTDLVMDLDCDFMPFGVGGNSENPQYEFLKWNYYPIFSSNGNHSINKNTGLVSGRFVNSIDTITTTGIKKTVLLSSSLNSRSISTPALISLNENRNTPEDAKFNRKDIPVALLLEGKFSSLFKNRITQAQIDSLTASGTSFFDAGKGDNKMIIVADGDMVLNDISPSEGPLPMGKNFFNVGSQYEYRFANKEFFLNCIEFLVNRSAISQTRNKDIVLRLLDSQKVKKQKTTWQFINIALPVIALLLFGIIYHQVRKRKYAS